MEKAREFQQNTYFCFIDYAKAFGCMDHNKLWKILQEMGIPDHLTCLLRNLYAGQEETVRTGHGTTDWFQIGKGVRQGYILSLCLFNLYAEYIVWNSRLLKPSLKDFEHGLSSRWNAYYWCGSLNLLWHCSSLELEWKLTFSSPMATAEFSKFAGIMSATLSQYHLLGPEIAQLEFYHLH